MKKRNAFTLAEVLITLGIIGVVAAMTLPVLIQKNNNRVVETRLKKFYSAINQAILMAENDYGDRKDWFANLSSDARDENGNIIEGSSDAEKWFRKYIAPYLKYTDIKLSDNGTYFYVYLPDGSAFRPTSDTTLDWKFYVSEPKKCDKSGSSVGICAFYFNFMPSSKDDLNWKYLYNKGFEPYKYGWDGNISTLYSGSSHSCNSTSDNAYCTTLIQMNDWKIPDDYPYKVKY